MVELIELPCGRQDYAGLKGQITGSACSLHIRVPIFWKKSEFRGAKCSTEYVLAVTSGFFKHFLNLLRDFPCDKGRPPGVQ